MAGRLSVAFLLDFVAIGRADRDLLESLITLAVVQANIAPISREPDLQRAYGAYDSPPPDEARRPVSISAVAGSLGLPYETVRRRVAALARQGICVVNSAGVHVPQAVLSSPMHMTATFAAYERLRLFYYQLRDLGVLPDYPPPGPPVEANAMVRAVMRLFGDYFLRTVNAVNESVGDLVGGLVLLGIFRANTEHIVDGPGIGADPEGVIADSERRPVSATHLSERLCLPKETVRRHVIRLLAEGRCQRTSEGLIVPLEVLARATPLLAVGQHLSHLNRLFSGLAELGVLAAWDTAREPVA